MPSAFGGQEVALESLEQETVDGCEPFIIWVLGAKWVLCKSNKCNFNLQLQDFSL